MKLQNKTWKTRLFHYFVKICFHVDSWVQLKVQFPLKTIVYDMYIFKTYGYIIYQSKYGFINSWVQLEVHGYIIYQSKLRYSKKILKNLKGGKPAVTHVFPPIPNRNIYIIPPPALTNIVYCQFCKPRQKLHLIFTNSVCNLHLMYKRFNINKNIEGDSFFGGI